MRALERWGKGQEPNPPLLRTDGERGLRNVRQPSFSSSGLSLVDAAKAASTLTTIVVALTLATRLSGFTSA
jgi:hypothetical protein